VEALGEAKAETLGGADAEPTCAEGAAEATGEEGENLAGAGAGTGAEAEAGAEARPEAGVGALETMFRPRRPPAAPTAELFGTSGAWALTTPVFLTVPAIPLLPAVTTVAVLSLLPALLSASRSPAPCPVAPSSAPTTALEESEVEGI